MGAVPRCAGGARAQRGDAEPLSGRRHVPPPERAGRTPRRRSHAGDHGRRRRRDHRPPLARDPRSRRRGGDRLAVLRQLRPRHAQAWGRAPHGAARGRPLRPRRASRCDRAEDEARLHRDAEQPHGDDDLPRAARRLLRQRPRARAHRRRPGVLRVRRAPRLPGRDRGVHEGGAPRARPPHLLQDLRPRRAACRLRDRAGRRRRGDLEDAAGLRRDAQAQVAALASMGETAELRSGAGSPTRAARRSSARSASTGSSRPGRRSRTSSSPRSATTRAPLYEALLRQGAIVRPMGAFGAPGALRITVGTPDENAFFAEALASVRAATA